MLYAFHVYMDRPIALSLFWYSTDSYAAINAILNKSAESLDGCIIYMTKCPTNQEAKLVIQAGIKKVIYFYKESDDDSDCRAARKLLADAEVTSRW